MKDQDQTSTMNGILGGDGFALGLFAANCSGGQAATKVAERWDASWENNRTLAILADEAGIDFVLPIARWRGFGGETGFQHHVLETVTWAAGLLAATKSIAVFATTHTAFFHPVAAAKQIATMTQIGSGRYGLNVVCGWNAAEYRMFGLNLPPETEARYSFGQEWLDIVRKMWVSSEAFDWNGTFFQLCGVPGDGDIFQGVTPTILNAGASGPGRDFGARNADCCFITMVDTESVAKDVRAIEDVARTRYQRHVKVLAPSHVVCRPTSREAHDYYEYYAGEMADNEAVDNLMEVLGASTGSKSYSPDHYRLFRKRFAGGHGTYPIVGSPDDVADELYKMAKTGLAGTAMSFVNYLAELPFFCAEVLPRLNARGLRTPLRMRTA